MDLAKPFADTFSADTLTLFKTDLWSVLVRKGQSTLGSLVLAANRNFISASEMTPEEAGEFPYVVGQLEGALRGAFNFDKINYVCLMMVDRHYHFHVYPRYEAPRTYDGVEYTDETWPRPVNITVPPSDDEFLIRLRDHLHQFLPKS
jgi:diadenosine tetraphosphate (Ap4A) HIT family hydrolase